VLLVGFSRIPIKTFWVVVTAWELLFVWYAWLSPPAPFALHELHSLDGKAMVAERTAHYVRAGALFAVLFVWFLSLPFARSMLRRGAAAGERR